jgi:4-amino-4-deoxy-L-arabinose transferase-like glycosyltransferase
MADMRRFKAGDLVLFLAVVACAAGLRVWYLAACCQNGVVEGPFRVQDDWGVERDGLVSHLLDGQGFRGPAPFHAADGGETTAHIAPAYPWLLSMLVRSAPDRVAAYQRARWLQCALGALTAGLCFLFARRAFHSLLAGTLAGVLAAIYPFWIVNTAEVNDGTLATFMLALCLFLGARGTQVGGALTSLLYGLSMAGLALTRAALLPFAFVAVFFFLMACRMLPRGWLYALLVFLGFINGLLPWTWRNYQAFGTVMPLVDSTYYHLWMGNNLQADGGPLPDSQLLQALAAARNSDGKTVAADLEQQSQPARYRSLSGDVWNEIRNQPAETLRRRLQAGIAFFLGQSFVNRQPLWGESTAVKDVPEWLGRWLPTLLIGSLLFMLAFGAVGWRWSYGWRHQSIPAALAVIWIPLPYLLGHAELLHGPRLPLDAVFLSYTAFVLACVVPPVAASLFRGGDSEPGN